MPARPPALDLDELRTIGASFAASSTTTGEASPRLERTTAARLARAICGVLALRHPGHSIELRVPPFAAVQLSLDDAGAHRRGTPPNVVETDATTLVRLAAGVLSWDEARERHLLRASGVRSDLSRLFPLVPPS